jgi:hypothetical protein
VRDKESVEKLEKLIHKMNLPFNRTSHLNPTKLKWLQKNMVERNSDNIHFNEAMEIIEKLIDNG